MPARPTTPRQPRHVQVPRHAQTLGLLASTHLPQPPPPLCNALDFAAVPPTATPLLILPSHYVVCSLVMKLQHMR